VRICFVFDGVYPFTKGGVEKRISDVSGSLAARGHDVHVIGTRYWESPSRIEPGRGTYHGLDMSGHLYNRWGKRSASHAVGFAFRLIPILMVNRFDVVETQSTLPLTTLVAWVVSKFRRQTLAIYWHEVWGSHWIGYAPVAGWVAWLLEYVCARLDVIHVAASITTATRVAELGRRHVAIVPLGIDTGRVVAVSPSPNENDLLYVGRLIQSKNLDLLLDSLAVLRRDGVTPKVTIVGDGPDRMRLIGRAGAMGLDHVDFVGGVQSDAEVLALMKSAKLLVHPSAREGFGLVVLEAATCGLPTIAIDSPDNAIRELLDDSQLVEPASPRAMASRIHHFLTDETARLDLAERSRNLAQAFSVERIAQVQEDVFLSSGVETAVLVP